MDAVPLKDGVYWVGAIDWNVREFHGYSTSRGTTYNAYLVKGEKIALVDTVKAEFYPEMMARIESIVNPEDIDYLVVNHLEMDHSGALPAFMERVPKVQLLATDNGIKGMTRHYRQGFSPSRVKTGESIDLGGKTLQFLEAYMLHWPDSMFTYIPEDQLLLPNDAFGQHFASSQRFDDELPNLEMVMDEAAKYFANILMPVAPLIPPLLKKVERMGLQVEMIAPSHGIIWRSHLERILHAYGEWSKGVAEDRALIIYDSMWGSTERMARAVSAGMTKGGLQNKLIHVRRNHYSDIIKDVLTAKVLVIGSPTINEGIFPSVEQVLYYLRGLRPLKKKGAVFGSYGWGGEAIKAMEEQLKAMGVEIVESGLGVMYVPGDEDMTDCTRFGEAIARGV